MHLVSLGCARNDVDSEELAARLEAGGFRLVDDPEQAEAVMVNTCGFVESAKKDSVDTLLAAADLKSAGTTRAVVAVGCLAERYGRDLAESLPEADAVLGFDDYADVSARLQDILAGGTHVAHAPRDRRALLPISPVQRPAAAGSVAVPGHQTAPDLPGGLAPASGPRAVRRRLGSGPMAPLKIASGCDRRCTFCAIPSFRGAYVSRPPADVVAEARWLAEQGVREVFLVSENSSSYGKDLGDIRAMETMLGELAAVDGIDWVRVSYLQPAETRASLVTAMTSIEGVVPYFDLSFQHAAPAVLRRMKRFGDPDSFLGLIESIRERAPQAGIRSNVIVGFPGESEADFQTLLDFVEAARLDAVGVFDYSDEDGTAAASLDGHLPAEVVEERRSVAVDLATEMMDQRAEDRIGERVRVLVETDDTDDPDEPAWIGRSAHQGPEVDGATRVVGPDGRPAAGLAVGDLVEAVVVASEGPELVAEVLR
ncbi:ribosomal protein S12 methylthiotransferase RimO [Auraticoccus monumenti]|uniref:Ribosomal protein uS12 methylthiotransferase RimO n=1 Tax=Auraticoccus monumenti TaxID=675864 RepID=A0A1G7CMP0_9ACTN|nr:ribosomal protein S12 methylthiotransferase RimO [Auraticoccus monumenti]